MVNYAYILIPLYIYPIQNQNRWGPLFDAARSHPDLTFRAIINPGDGPGGDACPNGEYIAALRELNSIPNIQTVGYVHTATSSTCGTSGTDICVCSQPEAAIQANITRYADWPTNCGEDIYVGGIFFDEAPSNSSCLSYMQSISAFAKDTMTRGDTVVYNPGVAVDPAYWAHADYINTFENNEAGYRITIIDDRTGNGEFADQANFIIYDYQSPEQLQQDVQDIIGVNHGGVAGLFLSSANSFVEFGANWGAFVDAVQAVVDGNN